MSFQSQYSQMETHLQFDLGVAASNTALRQLLQAEVALLNNELLTMSIPIDLTQDAQRFAMEYGAIRQRLLWMEDLIAVLDTSLELLTTQV